MLSFQHARRFWVWVTHVRIPSAVTGRTPRGAARCLPNVNPGCFPASRAERRGDALSKVDSAGAAYARQFRDVPMTISPPLGVVHPARLTISPPLGVVHPARSFHGTLAESDLGWLTGQGHRTLAPPGIAQKRPGPRFVEVRVWV